jgi:two-component system cell cycle response regulator CpdR
MLMNKQENSLTRVLLAENDAAMRTFLAQTLRRAGFEVVAVADGGAAMAELGSSYFDLLLSEIIVPVIGGVELARACERLCPDTRIVLITGFAAVSIEPSREAPRATVLSKPFHLRVLIEEVERLFA